MPTERHTEKERAREADRTERDREKDRQTEIGRDPERATDR